MMGKKNINEWIDLIRKRDRGLISRLESIYGQDKALLDERLMSFLKITSEFRHYFGEDKEVRLVRAPGRLNTLGMHIDHRGGFINPIAINRETLLCYAGRDDDLIHLHNPDTSYGERKFNLSRELPSGRIGTTKDWLAWTQEQTNKRRQDGTDEDWVNKLKAVPVYLQVMFRERKLSGFEGVIDSNIPAGMGLSSSSAILVAVMEAMLDTNRISITADQFVNYCGIAEWFVGTRGGSGDHAAIKFSRLGMIAHMKTLPRLVIKSYLPFPEGYKIVIFDSGIIANKTGPARQKFNEKTATCEIGEIYVREYMKRRHGKIFREIVVSRAYLSAEEKKLYLADVIECLDRSHIYELLEHLPECIDRQGLLEQLPEYENFLRKQFATHLEPEAGYRLRSVVTYGIAESQRSSMVEDVIKESGISFFGQLMNISHDGDRVSFPSPEKEKRKRAIDPEQELYLQPGGYDCSLPGIDEMVDLALDSGAEGAQISGAGLGGSIMALVKDDNFNRLVETLRVKYYQPRKIKENFIVVFPVRGAGQL